MGHTSRARLLTAAGRRTSRRRHCSVPHHSLAEVNDRSRGKQTSSHAKKAHLNTDSARQSKRSALSQMREARSL